MSDYRLIKIGNSPYFYVVWREGGKPKRVSTRQTDRRKAKEFLTEFRREYEKLPVKTDSVPNILDWYFREHASKKPSSPQAAIAIDHLKHFFGGIYPDKLTLALQADYVATRRLQPIKNQPDKRISDETVSRELSVLSAALRLCHKHGLIDAPPKINLPSKAPPRERWLTRDEVAKWYAYLRTRPRLKHVLLFTQLALHSGARSGAILGLTWSRVQFDIDLIDYIDPDEPETNKRATTAHMTPKLKWILTKAKARAKTDYVIEERKQPVIKISRAFLRHVKEAGLENFTPHTLRHTFATWAMRNAAKHDISLFDLAQAMGHTSVRTTQRYAKHMPGAHKRVIAAAGRR